jgi:hypothetical protein
LEKEKSDRIERQKKREMRLRELKEVYAKMKKGTSIGKVNEEKVGKGKGLKVDRKKFDVHGEVNVAKKEKKKKEKDEG